jgi:hypothetical protein
VEPAIGAIGSTGTPSLQGLRFRFRIESSHPYPRIFLLLSNGLSQRTDVFYDIRGTRADFCGARAAPRRENAGETGGEAGPYRAGPMDKGKRD